MSVFRLVVLTCVVAVLTAFGTSALTAQSLSSAVATPVVVARTISMPEPISIPTRGVVESSTPTAGESLLVSLQRSGGFTGKNETLTVYTNGRIEWLDYSGRLQIRHVADEELVPLRALLTSEELNHTKDEYHLSGADLRTYELTWQVRDTLRTITTMDAAKHPHVIDRVFADLVRLRPQAP